MYAFLLSFHSLFRWLVLIALLFAIYRAARGFFNHQEFSKADNSIRHWTATIGHIQLLVGIILYTKSPQTSFFWNNFKEAMQYSDTAFFGLYHLLLMLFAVIVLTIGSAKAKRMESSKEQYRTMLIWFSIALLIILIAIPWPFSPLANRPYLRPF